MFWIVVATIIGTLVAFLIVPMRSLGSDKTLAWLNRRQNIRVKFMQ